SLTCLKDIYTPPHISGATILGDGTVTLILDVESIIKLATHSRVKQAEGEVKVEEEEGYKAIIVDDGMAEQYAIPLKLIKKVELIPAGEIEVVGNKEVVKYGGEALPITRLYYLTQYPSVPQFQSVYMLIVSEGGRRGGLITNRMHGLKLIKQSETTDSFTNAGVLRSVILDNRVTLILNDKMIIENIYSENKVVMSRESGGQASRLSSEVYLSKKTILLVDDSSTHRSVQGKVVQEAGYDVIYAEDGEEGLKKLSGVLIYAIKRLIG
ncbi:MAG: chemotaxis protein CheW, partial [Nitrospinae bacterium]|nr:chemotaxis protein CheW [Nitrospinota bacterium]